MLSPKGNKRPTRGRNAAKAKAQKVDKARSDTAHWVFAFPFHDRNQHGKNIIFHIGLCLKENALYMNTFKIEL